MYDLYSDFDIEQHKKHYTNYLEVVILDDGTIEYAVPSHQQKMLQMACLKHNMTDMELVNSTPREFMGDWLFWLCFQSGCVAVWNDFIEHAQMTTAQIASLRRLKMAGLYHGTIPSVNSPFIIKKRGGG